jgi:ribulose-phosphate 3-epimerase
MRAAIDECGRKVVLEVDGGINAETLGDAIAAGADLLVSGSAIFKHPDGPRIGVTTLLAEIDK